MLVDVIAGDVSVPDTALRRSARRALVARLAAAAASGALLALSREPFDLDLLALVALIPLLWAWRGQRPRRAALLAFVAGVVYHGLLVSWLWYFGAVALVPLVAVLAGYWAAIGATVAWCASHHWRHPLVTASVWVLADALVSRVPWGGFSWGEAGYALSEISAARSIASWGGVTLVTFLVVAFADACVDLAVRLRTPSTSSRARPALVTLVLIGLVAGVLARTTVDTTAGDELRFALLQGNDLNRDLTRAEIDDRTLARKHFDVAAGLEGDYDLVVFPESSMDEDPRVDRSLEAQLVEVARRHDTAVLANAVADAPDGRAVNLNLLYGPSGALEGTYAKRHLVPFGEFVPFRSVVEPLVPAIEREIPRDFAPGDSSALFDVAGHPVSTIICFETAFGPLVRDTVRDGAELIVVSTNNRSYRRSAQASQHVELSQMRAAETGRPVLHSSINGITAVIEADGRVTARSELFVNSLTEGTITTTGGQTPYVRFGEWVTLVALVVVGIGVAAAVLRRSRSSVDSETEISSTGTTDS